MSCAIQFSCIHAFALEKAFLQVNKHTPCLCWYYPKQHQSHPGQRKVQACSYEGMEMHFFFFIWRAAKQTSLLLKKKRKVNGKNGTCEWQKAELKQPQSSLLLTGCPWAWTSFLEPHSCSWFHLSMVLLGSLAPGMPERI